MICMKPVPLSTPSLPPQLKAAYVQPKLNGIRAFWDPDKEKLLTRTGKTISSCPHIVAAIKSLPLPYNQLKLDGEIYKHQLPLQVISGAVRRYFPSALSAEFEYHIFDFISSQPYLKRKHLLDNLPANNPIIKCVKTVFVDGTEADSKIQFYCEQFVQEGYEGIIIRNPSAPYDDGRHVGFMWKYKPVKYMECELIGLRAATTDRNAATFGSLKLRTPDGFIVYCSGLADHDREIISNNFSRLYGRKVLISYDELSLEGKPMRLRFEQLVEED